MKALYLHGFASTPRSTKGVLVAELLKKHGIETVIPDLQIPSFHHLSPIKILETVEKLMTDQINICIGSSFGGFIALKTLSKLAQRGSPLPKKLILLAPVIDPSAKEGTTFTEATVKIWREKGEIPVFHHGLGKEELIHFGFVEELENVGAFNEDFNIETLIIHGSRDVVVPIRTSVELAERLKNVKLVTVDEGHELLEKPARVLKIIEKFLFSFRPRIDILETS